MFKKIVFPALCILAVSCNSGKKVDKKAADIVSACIDVHGGKNYEDMDVSFTFRKYTVHLKHKGGTFLYERVTKDTLDNVILDKLTNNSYGRWVNGKKLDLSQKDAVKFKNGLNAIAYFALLPYKLSEPAVNLKYLGETRIENKIYEKIEISFDESGGGKDHEDEFCFWIGRDDHTMDYLSYASGGPRFRKAIKRTTVDGVVFQDYENYEVMPGFPSANDYDSAYLAGKVTLLSTIGQQNYISHK